MNQLLVKITTYLIYFFFLFYDMHKEIYFKMQQISINYKIKKKKKTSTKENEK